jgi:hypothetical protein
MRDSVAGKEGTHVGVVDADADTNDDVVDVIDNEEDVVDVNDDVDDDALNSKSWLDSSFWNNFEPEDVKGFVIEI